MRLIEENLRKGHVHNNISDMDKAKRDEIKGSIQSARNMIYEVYGAEPDSKKRTKLGAAMASCDRAIEKLNEADGGYAPTRLAPSPPGR